MGEKTLRPWRETWLRERVPRLVAGAGFAIALIAMLGLGQIQGQALRQPRAPGAEFTHPYFVKGRWLYITDRQLLAGDVASGMLPFGGILFLAGALWAAREEAVAGKRARIRASSSG